MKKTLKKRLLKGMLGAGIALATLAGIFALGKMKKDFEKSPKVEHTTIDRGCYDPVHNEESSDGYGKRINKRYMENKIQKD